MTRVLTPRRAFCSFTDASATCRRRARRETAFTLVEVVVVVAILALLIAILMPALMSARAQARRTGCQTNLHNLAIAWQAYLDEHNGRFLRGYLNHIKYGGKEGSRKQFTGQRPLNKYLGIPAVTRNSHQAAVFRCPGDRGSFIQAEELVFSSYFDFFGTSYRTNRFLIGPQPPTIGYYDPCKELLIEAQKRLGYEPEVGGAAGGREGGDEEEQPPGVNMTVNLVSNESRLILMGDYGWEDWWSGSVPPPQLEFHQDSYSATAGSVYDAKARSWYNIGFMDGHAGFIPIRKGLSVTPDYTVIPFRDMQQAFAERQKPGMFGT